MSQYVDEDILWKRNRACDAMKAKQRKDTALSEDAKKSVAKIAERFETRREGNAFIDTMNLIAKAEAEGKFPPRGGAS